MIVDSEKSVGVEALKVFESFLGAKLPKEYFEHLLNYNGGYPQPDAFNFLDGGTASSVQEFYKLNSKDAYNDLIQNYKMFQDRIPTELIAVGCDPGGNQICLAINGQDFGKVLFWDHEFEADNGETPTYENIRLISKNFNSFLESLYEIT